MSMFSERLQILVSREQRQRLEEEARRRGCSVAMVVREAIEAHMDVATEAERRDALTAISSMKGRYLTPAELDAIIGEERDQATRHD